ncbi:hypothetical protein ABZW49_10585 [Nonomuraea wenchangensis]
MITAEETRTQYAVKGTAAKHGKWQVIVQIDPLHTTDRERVEEAVQEQRYWQEQWNLTPDAELVTRSWTGNGWTDWEHVADEPSAASPFDPSALTVAADHVHALAQPEADVLVWDHHAGEVRAMTREDAIASGFVAFTNRGWLNDWTREPGCWNDDHTDVTPECAERLAGVLTEWLRRIT